MKFRWLLTIVVALIFSSCNGQEKQIGKNKLGNAKKSPNENVKVNKEYDRDGNLIKYDSTYTYYYSNIENDTLAEDSILINFKKMFDNKYPFTHSPFFNDMFFQDSLMKYDFYKGDFFIERFRRNMEQTEKMFREMDSIKNNFYMKQFPEK